MDNVTVHSLNNISGSILSDGVETQGNCELKDCIVNRGHHFNEIGGKTFSTIFVSIRNLLVRNIEFVFFKGLCILETDKKNETGFL